MASDISVWSTTPNANGTLGATPIYWPEGQAPSTVNNCARQMMAAIRLQWNDAQWFNWGYTTTRVSGASFTVVTAAWNTVPVADVFQVGGRLRLHDTAATLYGTITTVSVSAASVQVTFTPDASSLTATCSAVYNSIITADQKSIPSAAVPADVVRQSGAQIYAADGGATDAYSITMTPAIAAYTAGMTINFKANSANTGGATLNAGGGVAAIVNPDGSALVTGAISAGQIVRVVYDGVNWQMQSATSSGTSSSGRLLNIQTFYSGVAATYTPTAGTNIAIIKMLGGGGAGGGAAGVAGNTAAGGGGGAGGYVEHQLNGVSGTYTYTIGVGGTPGSAGNNTGGNGAATTFSGGALSAGGGSGGGGAAAQNAAYVALTAVGGASGNGTGGNLVNLPGQAGFQGFAYLNSGVISGEGGNNIFGNGASPVAAGPSSQTTGNAGPAGTGTGGSGGASYAGASVAGGAGGSGLIIITEYS